MVFGFLKNLFRPSPINRAFEHCLEADELLMKKVMMFQMSYRAVGIELAPDTSSFPQLERILDSCDANTKEPTYDGVAFFLGCVIREQLCGKWTKTQDGRYRITALGNAGLTVDLIDDLRFPLTKEPRARLKELYGDIVAAGARDH
jgi:hypothetical protein